MYLFGWALHIVDVLWTAQRMNGEVMLCPFASVVAIYTQYEANYQKITT